MKSLEALLLGIRDRQAALLLAGQRFDLSIELSQQSVGFGVLFDGFAGFFVSSDRGMLGGKIAQLPGFVHNLLRVHGHELPR